MSRRNMANDAGWGWEVCLLSISKVINKELDCSMYWQILVRKIGPGGVSSSKVESVLKTYLQSLIMSKENG